MKQKKNLMTYLLLFSCLSMTIVAQSRKIEPTKQTTFGFKGGFNKSVINGREFGSCLARAGYVGYEMYGGLFSNTKLSEKLNLENELLFSYTDEYIFIEIPIHLKYKIREKWSVLLGPKMDFIPSKYANYEFEPMGISAELGVQYDINKRYFAELRISKGFTQQVNDFVLNIYDGVRNTFRFGLGVNF